mgnify:CR=1 FL=1
MYENTISEILKAQTDKEELGKIVENNSGLVWSIVKRFRGRLGVRDNFKKFYVKLPEGVSLENVGA